MGTTVTSSPRPRLYSELSSAGGSNALASLVGKNVEKAVRLFTMQCEEMVLSGREVVQVSGPPNPAQLQNLSLANTLHAFTRTVRQVCWETLLQERVLTVLLYINRIFFVVS